MVHGIQQLNYDDRLNYLGLMRLEKRKVRNDLNETFKFMNGMYDDVDVDVDGVDERRPKPRCPHRKNTLQYSSLLIFFTPTFTATSSSVQLCYKIVYNILILPKFI